jgi:hydrogenase nickel incorporation protein HypA/HybF
MHEGAIVSSLFEIAEHSFQDSGLSRVTKVRIVVGKLHQIVTDVMVMHFDLMKRDIPGFEQAVLEIKELDPEIRCKRCGAAMVLDEVDFSCRACGSEDTELTYGNELYIDALEGEERSQA